MATTPRMKITYATLSADNEELQSSFDAAVERARADLGRAYPMIIGAEERFGTETFDDRSPIDTDLVVGRFPVGTRQDVRDAIAAARAALPAWRDTPWRERLALLRRAADIISERQFDYAALMALEVGKNRLEALGDVEETADLLRYYGDEFEKADGFVKPLGSLSPTERTRSILRPYGVFGVISPFNFPMALAGGPAAGAMIAGNTVVLKPSSDAPLMGWKFGEALRDAGVPAGVFNLVTGPGETVGAELQENPGIDGMVFTGSYEVGMKLYRSLHEGLPAADHHRDGREEPRHRDPPRRPRRGGRGRHALGLRLRRPEVLGATRASTSSARWRASSSTGSSRRRGRSPSATRRGARTGWARSSTSARSTRSRAPSTTREPTAARSRSAARSCATATPRAASSPPRPS